MTTLFDLLDTPARAKFFGTFIQRIPALANVPEEQFLEVAAQAWEDAVEAQEIQHIAVTVINDDAPNQPQTAVYAVSADTPRVACHVNSLMANAGTDTPFAAVELELLTGKVSCAAAGHSDGLASYLSNWPDAGLDKPSSSLLEAFARIGYEAESAMCDGYRVANAAPVPAEQEQNFLGTGMGRLALADFFEASAFKLHATGCGLNQLHGVAFMQVAYLIKQVPHVFEDLM